MASGNESSSKEDEYEIFLDSRAARDLENLGDRDSARVHERIRSLRQDRRPRGAAKLAGDVYRVRSGDWRIIYVVDDDEKRVVISRVKRREKDTYKDL